TGVYFCSTSGTGPGTGVAEAGAVVCCAEAAVQPAATARAVAQTPCSNRLRWTMTRLPSRELVVFTSDQHVSQVGTMPTRPVNGLATARLPFTILSGSAARARGAGPSISAAPSRGLKCE